MQTKKWAALIIVAALVGALAGCGITERPTSTGSVLLSLDNVQARSILPPISMDVTEYLVSASGPSGSSYGPELLTGSTVIEDLLPGSWSFTVIGRNAAHNAIGEGAGGCTVIIGQTATCAITVAEYASPDGSFLLDLAWEPNIVSWPVWAGSLKDFAAVNTSMVFTVDDLACTAQSTVNPLHTGWFTMIIKLFDAPLGLDGSEVLSTGAACAVRVAAGRQTHGDLFLHAVQGFGMIDLQLELDFHDPLVLSPNIPFGAVPIFADEQRAFSVTADETCSSIYYLRGQQVGVDGYALDAEDLLFGEPYRLDVVAFNVDGSRAASGTWEVTRSEIPQGAYDLLARATNGTASSAYMKFRLYDFTWTVLAEQIISGVTAGAIGSYTFAALAEGTYYVGVEFQSFPDYVYWSAAGYAYTQGGADPIIIPGSPPSAHVADFGVLNQY